MASGNSTTKQVFGRVGIQPEGPPRRDSHSDRVLNPRTTAIPRHFRKRSAANSTLTGGKTTAAISTKSGCPGINSPGIDSLVVNSPGHLSSIHRVTCRQFTGPQDNLPQHTELKDRLPKSQKHQAERAGFEPAVGEKPLRRFSKPVHSTTLPSLQWCAKVYQPLGGQSMDPVIR
jgi:hypothetical protein